MRATSRSTARRLNASMFLGPYRSGDFELLKYIRYYTEHEAQQTYPTRFWQLLLARV